MVIAKIQRALRGLPMEKGRHNHRHRDNSLDNYQLIFELGRKTSVDNNNNGRAHTDCSFQEEETGEPGVLVSWKAKLRLLTNDNGLMDAC